MTYSCSDFASDVLATMVEVGALPEEAGDWEPGEAADAVCAAIKRMAAAAKTGHGAPEAAAVPAIDQEHAAALERLAEALDEALGHRLLLAGR